MADKEMDTSGDETTVVEKVEETTETQQDEQKEENGEEQEENGEDEENGEEQEEEEEEEEEVETDESKQKALWAKEEALTLEERRARYRCQMSSVTNVDNITNWNDFMAQEHQPPTSTLLRKYKPMKEPNAELNKKIALWRGNIVTLEIDAIQNAANNSCLGGGGIDGAIHRAASRALVNECYLLHGCDTGNTKITRGYALPAKWVLHTVGPIGENKAALQGCYKTTLDLCAKHNIRHVALCGVSTGIFGYPRQKATIVALNTVREWLLTGDNINKIDKIVFVVFLPVELEVYTQTLPVFFPPVEPFIKPKVASDADANTEGTDNNNNSNSTSDDKKDNDGGDDDDNNDGDDDANDGDDNDDDKKEDANDGDDNADDKKEA